MGELSWGCQVLHRWGGGVYTRWLWASYCHHTHGAGHPRSLSAWCTAKTEVLIGFLNKWGWGTLQMVLWRISPCFILSWENKCPFKAAHCIKGSRGKSYRKPLGDSRGFTGTVNGERLFRKDEVMQRWTWSMNRIHGSWLLPVERHCGASVFPQVGYCWAVSQYLSNLLDSCVSASRKEYTVFVSRFYHLLFE